MHLFATVHTHTKGTHTIPRYTNLDTKRNLKMKKRKKRSRPADPWSKTRIPARTQRRTSGEVKQEQLQRKDQPTEMSQPDLGSSRQRQSGQKEHRTRINEWRNRSGPTTRRAMDLQAIGSQDPKLVSHDKSNAEKGE